jgi:hypothetical protein
MPDAPDYGPDQMLPDGPIRAVGVTIRSPIGATSVTAASPPHRSPVTDRPRRSAGARPCRTPFATDRMERTEDAAMDLAALIEEFLVDCRTL